jgi:WD40 repeat protein
VHYDGQWTVDGLAVSPDGRWVAYGYEAGIGVLHVGRADRLGEMLEPLWSSSRIRAVAFAPGGDRLFCASATRDPRVLASWGLGQDGVPTSERRDQTLMSAGLAIALSPDGVDLVVGTSGGTILRLPPDGTEVDGADPDVTGKRILSALELGGLLRQPSTAGRVETRDVAFSADGALLFTLVGDEEGSTLEVWRRSGWTRLVERLPIPRRAGQLAPGPDGRRLLVGALGGVEVWDVPEALRRGEPLPR